MRWEEKIIFQCFAFPRETLNLLAKHSLAKVLNFLNFASAQISEDASDISEVVLALKAYFLFKYVFPSPLIWLTLCQSLQF